MEHCIVYFSFSVNPFSQEDITTILEESRRNNAEHDITGVLLYMNGSIVQILEGQQKVIEDLLGRIKKDSRHKEVAQVFSRPIKARLFPDWSMGYETVTSRELANIKEIVNLYTDERIAIEAGENIVIKMIKLFYESNRRKQAEYS
ncbi:BLUF domain-containing protein [Spirosoma arcticum]